MTLSLITALSATGSEPATHYASSTWASPTFLAMLTDPATQEAVLTSLDWTPAGGEETVRAILRGQRDGAGTLGSGDGIFAYSSGDISDADIGSASTIIGPDRPGEGARQFAKLLATHGLQRIT